MFADVVLGVVLISVIGIQALMIRFYQERFSQIHRQLNALIRFKAEKNHSHRLIEGNLDMEYRGRVARCKATFYPKRMN
jgi:hypothetical protein